MSDCGFVLYRTEGGSACHNVEVLRSWSKEDIVKNLKHRIDNEREKIGKTQTYVVYDLFEGIAELRATLDGQLLAYYEIVETEQR